MTPLTLSSRQLRELDRQAIHVYGIPGPVLMENAGKSAADYLLSCGLAGKVVICCGKGNNGGDGLVIARHLDAAGVAVEVILAAPANQLSTDAALQYRIVAKSGISLSAPAVDQLTGPWLAERLVGADWIVDALFGTGLTGPLRPPLDQVVTAINNSPAKKLAVDIPSGLNGDTGEPLCATIRASHTVTFVARKPGFGNPNAAAWLGKVVVMPIGLPRRLLDSAQSI
jgi:NAD(P)H-hydrate epimerase